MVSATSTYRAIGFWGILALICLRVLVGWHFYMEGVAKVREGGFSSVGFLGGAKGPLAKNFQSMLPDYDGTIRLDRDKMLAAYKAYLGRVRNSYSFNVDQTEQAEEVLNESMLRWDALTIPMKSKIDEYNQGFARIAELAKDPKRTGVASLRSQRDEIETKWRALVKPLLADINKSSVALEHQLQSIATVTQKRNIGEIPFDLSGGPISVRLIDKVIPIFDMSVGILLILGLLTRVAGIASGLFLASVVLTQFPGYPGTQPTYYQAIEMVACFLLAFADAGRFAGLDFFPWSYWNARAATKR